MGYHAYKRGSKWDPAEGLSDEQARVVHHVISCLGYGNTAPEPPDPDEHEDGRNDSEWVADCVRLLTMLVAALNDYYGRASWTAAGKREREHRGEVGFTG